MCTPVFTVALFTIAKTWKQPKCPLKGTDKESVVYTQWYILQPLNMFKEKSEIGKQTKCHTKGTTKYTQLVYVLKIVCI